MRRDGGFKCAFVGFDFFFCSLYVTCMSCLSVSGEVFDSSTAESSPVPSTNGENMVTPTPTRPRTTEDLFAAIHRYHDALLSLTPPLLTPSSTPTSLLLARLNSQYIIYSTEPVHFSSLVLQSFRFLLFVFLSSSLLFLSASHSFFFTLVNHNTSP